MKMALIERRDRALLDHRRVARHAGTHSDAKIRVARDFSVPRSNLRRCARVIAGRQDADPFEPTRRRNRPEALSTCVRPYERTSLPAWHQEPTNWCHGYPAGHAWSLLPPGRPPSSPDGRRWPNPTFRPLMATFLMLLRSRGAIGRVRATPGRLPTARTAQTRA